MATIYERYQRYLEKYGHSPLSKKKYKGVCRYIKYQYDSSPGNPPIEYIESIENNISYTVRNYPDTFIKVMDRIIRRIGEKRPDSVLFPKPKAISTRQRKMVKRPIYKASSK
jgi:hypothetical protein